MIARARGTTDVPLSLRGKQQLAADAQKIGQRGGFDLILSSPLYRARQTAKAFLAVSPPGAKMMIMPGLMPQSQGAAEGQPKEQVSDMLHDYEDNRPDEPLPGVSRFTGKPGESFSTARQRFLGKGLIPGMKLAQDNPGLRVLALTHSSNIKIAEGWDKAGRPSDLTIAPRAMHQETEWPGAIVHMDEKGFKELNPDEPGPIPAGFYLGRHGETPWGG